MSILTATLLSLLYFWGNSAFVLGVNWWTVMRPLVSGFLAGVIWEVCKRRHGGGPD